MSTLSQFTGGGERYRLKLKNGPYLDEYYPKRDGFHIRDFSAQNDSFMISMTSGDMFIGKRVDELIPIYRTGSLVFGNNITGYDVHVGGDPYGTPLNKVRSAYSYRTQGGGNNGRNSTIHTAWAGQQPGVAHEPTGQAVIVSTSNEATNNTYGGNLYTYLYTDGELFYFTWSSVTDRAYIYQYNQTSTTWEGIDWTYSGSAGPEASRTDGRFTAIACTYPQIIPDTGDIVMFQRYSTSVNVKVIYDASANSWTVEDVTGIDPMPQSEACCLSVNEDGTKMIITAADTTLQNYLYSSDSGDTWSTIDVFTSLFWKFRQCGFANGTFYAINLIGNVSNIGNQFAGGMLMSTQTPQTANSWSFVHTDLSKNYYLRSNQTGTACYVSTGNATGNAVDTFFPIHGILKLQG